MRRGSKSRSGTAPDRAGRWHVPLGIADQGASGLSNLIAVLVVASTFDAATFGAFSLVYTGVTLALGVARSYFGIPIAVSAGQSGNRGPLDMFGAVMGAILIASPAIIGALILLALVSPAGGEGVLLMIAAAFVTPLILMQDAGRFYLFATNCVGKALASDFAWLCCVLALWSVKGHLSSLAFALLWCLAPVVALLLALSGTRLRIDWAASRRLLVPGKEVKDAAAFAMLLSAGTTMLVGLILLPSFGLQALGTLRGAGTLFGPINSLIAFLDIGVLAMLARRPRQHDLRVSLIVGLAFVCIVVAWGTILSNIPADLGHFLLGETWTRSNEILPVTTIEYLFIALTASAILFLKVRGHAPSLFFVKVVSSSVVLLGSLMVSALGLGFNWIPWVLVSGAAIGACMQWLAVFHFRSKEVV